jgi:ketosteroid isomerase-like protein
MSQENVEVVQAFFDTWNAGDMDAVRELHDPDVIFRTVEDWPEPGPYVGREAVMRFMEQLREAWDADKVEAIGNMVDTADRVVVRLTWSGLGRGPDSAFEMTCIYTVREGRIRGHEFFWDHAKALKALGLSEQDAHADS